MAQIKNTKTFTHPALLLIFIFVASANIFILSRMNKQGVDVEESDAYSLPCIKNDSCTASRCCRSYKCVIPPDKGEPWCMPSSYRVPPSGPNGPCGSYGRTCSRGLRCVSGKCIGCLSEGTECFPGSEPCCKGSCKRSVGNQFSCLTFTPSCKLEGQPCGANNKCCDWLTCSDTKKGRVCVNTGSSR